MSFEPRLLGEDVRNELARFGPEAAGGAVVSCWPAAVGEAIAANAWPARFARDGTLHVSTSSSAWAFELTQLEETVRASLAERLGAAAPARLRFAIGPLPERSAESGKKEERLAPEPTEAERATAGRLAAPIADSELRELVARAAAASLARVAANRSV